MIKNILLVGFGGFIGSAVRYMITLTFYRQAGSNFPIGTFMVNMIGSFIIGLVLASALNENNTWKLLVATGFCGGFTTFSTFSMEGMRLLSNGSVNAAMIYMMGSLFIGLMLCAAGYIIGLRFLNL